MKIDDIIIREIVYAIEYIFEKKIEKKDILFFNTKKNIEGDYSLASFNLAKQLRISADEFINRLGNYLLNRLSIIESYTSINGFLNFNIKNNIWLKILEDFCISPTSFSNYKAAPVIIEFPSPNTNKPLHLGHLRNIFLGESMARIFEFRGYKVYRINLINDRGIHICKSMLAYSKFGNNETPESTNIKGDHFVGRYYVLFEQKLKEEIQNSLEENKDEIKNQSQLMKEAQEMLKKWENDDKLTIRLWKKMNSWVYKGFDETFEKLNIKFDEVFYESQTYLEGKKIVDEGLARKYFYKKEDNSVWIDLSSEGLDEKLVLRPDGTSVYITQDLGNADLRYKKFKFEKSIYIVGNEQDYHFKVLFAIFKKLNKPYASKLFHLSYGMVDLPEGKMKSREGTVVDADDLIDTMVTLAKKNTLKLGKVSYLGEEEATKIFNILAMGALKYFILKVDAKKRVLFNPQNSIDFQGDTGPFIQYTFARINSLLLKNTVNLKNKNLLDLKKLSKMNITEEKKIIKQLYRFDRAIEDCFEAYSPSIIAQYVYNLAKIYNKFYSENNILKEANEHIRLLRLLISSKVKDTIEQSLYLLGIESPSKM